MKVDYVEESSVRKAMTFEVEADVVTAEIDARAREYAKKAKIPGFRPGKIPVAVIKRQFKQQVLEEVAERLVNKYVHDEIEGRGLRPLASPKVTELKIDEGQPLTFKAVFETLPVIEVPSYEGLQIKVRGVKVTEEEIDAEVDRMREEAARYDPVEGRASRAGDFVVLDLTWKPEEGKGGREENALMEVGSAENHEQLNHALTGLAVGDTREVTIAYPADHAQQGLAGRTIHYSFTLKSVKDKVVPAADDEFAKDLGDEFGSLKELRDKVRGQFEASEQHRLDRDSKNALVEAVLQKASFDVPEALVAHHMDARLENAARGLAMQGIDPREAKIDWRAYRESMREESIKGAKADILLDEIGKRAKIDATPAEVDAEVERLAARMKRPVEAVRAKMEKDGELHGLRARLREEKVLDMIKATARIETE